MKKTTLCIFIVLMLLICGICLAEAVDPSSLIGDWTIVSVDNQDLSETGVDFSLLEGGSAILSWNDSTIEAGWYIENSDLTFMDDDGPIMVLQIINNETIQAQLEGTVYTFGKSTITFEAPVTAYAENSEPADFYGNWNATAIMAYGSELPASDFGVSLQMAIADGECTLITDTDELTYEAYFENGSMNIGADDDLISCRMRQDGTMVFDLADEEITMTVIMERVA